MSKLIIVVFSLLGLISACVGQTAVIQAGQCDINVPVVTDFDGTRYLGDWYDIESLPSTFQSGTCNTATYSANTDGTLNVLNTEVVSGVLQYVTGTAVPTGTAKYEVSISGAPAVPYWILATDYTTYALIYSCSNINANQRQVHSWKLGRNKGALPTDAANTINGIIASVAALNAASNQYIPRIHTAEACAYFVDFEGPCPTNVIGVPDFDIPRFLGTWYEVAKYPQPTQTGQCSRAQYALGAAGSVTVENSEVIDETLSTMLGTATAVTGQSGVLQVTFTVAGVVVNQNLYVLATDYYSYAIMYSCANLEGNRRRIGSWKMTKNTDILLDENAINVINAAIAATPDLSEVYYQKTSQTDAACFYYPEFDTLPPIIELPGHCDTFITGVANFDVTRYLGTWYEVAKYPQPTQTGQCSRAQYTLGDTGSVTVENSEVIDETLSTMLGTATAVTGQSGVLQVTFNIAGEPRSQNLYVLATDYDNYALVYSCTNIEGNKRQVGSWKLSRSKNPLSVEINNVLDNVITATQGLNEDYYQETSQTDAACFYYPKFESLPPIIELPGPCDTSITGVADFDVMRYLGTWYEVAKYPQPTQTGQCSRAQYTLGDTGSVSVENSEVIDETLSTMLGTATTVTGQSGVLHVTFNIAGEPRSQNLYVLATDYENYALVYSCTNIEGNKRQVGSWKLSRSNNPLSVEANNVLDNVVTATQGLNEDYYQETSQTDAACFYYPKFESLPPIIELPGPCDTSITGVADFDVMRYLGTWYEVAKYPQPTQTGQCSRAQYALGAAGSVTVENSEVIDETLSTMLGTATAVTGQSGVLQVTFNIAGEPRSQNLYVLATDYDNYALVYSCTNIEGNKRQVGSWKLSRSNNPLSVEANNVLDNVVTATQGLNEDYYQETSQTDAACFYYPKFESLPPIIELPGPCDTSITGVADFDVMRYLGTWYEVAKYPQPTQAGQCSRAQYTLGDTGSVTVENSEVIDETLSTMLGTATAVTGQSGVLQVTFNIAGVPRSQNLYVLATDYDNYALVYSCTNIEGNKRQVGSWKLSRSNNPLSVEANNVLDNVITATQGLREDYYEETSQTDAACWHYLPQNGLKVIIPGQCDTSISGVANINLPSFANSIWYQIQRYDAVGESSCIGSKLSYDEGYINVNSIEVIGEEAKITEGVARLTTADSGKFTLEMADSEEQEEIYILATDYNGYAIAYSCKNNGTDNRQIGAWQLSRGRTMPAAGIAAVDRLVAERREFTRTETYFKTIPQREDCPEPSSAFLFKSSIIVIFVCTILQLVW